MSIAEMQQYVAENINLVEDSTKLEQIVELIEREKKTSISVDELWAEITTKYDGVMKRLAQ